MVANCDHLRNLKFSPVLPNAFTEHGAIMAATVLNASRAFQLSIYAVDTNSALGMGLALETCGCLFLISRPIGSQVDSMSGPLTLYVSDV